jgi:hypothetical protein
MGKLLLILFLTGALAQSIAAAHSEPPLLIDSAPTPTAVD